MQKKIYVINHPFNLKMGATFFRVEDSFFALHRIGNFFRDILTCLRTYTVVYAGYVFVHDRGIAIFPITTP